MRFKFEVKAFLPTERFKSATRSEDVGTFREDWSFKRTRELGPFRLKVLELVDLFNNVSSANGVVVEEVSNGVRVEKDVLLLRSKLG